jgi:hypothetical protein
MQLLLKKFSQMTEQCYNVKKWCLINIFYGTVFDKSSATTSFYKERLIFFCKA